MEKYFDTIESWLRGELPPEEKAAFEAAMAADPALAQLVQQHRLERQALELLVEQDLFAKMRQWEAAASPQQLAVAAPMTATIPAPAMQVVRPWRNLVRWAAVFAVCIGAAWYLAVQFGPSDTLATSGAEPKPMPSKNTPHPKSTPTDTRETQNKPAIRPENKEKNTGKPNASEPERIAQAPESPKPPVIQPSRPSVPATPDYDALASTLYEEQHFFKNTGTTPRGGDALYEKAMDQYKTGKFSEVERLLKSALKSDDSKELLGHALYREGRYDEAFIQFRDASNARNKTLAQRAEWAMALTLLRQMPAKRNLLERVLQKIINDPGHLYYQKAKDLKGEI
jgi:tetratricopeptide (TPR) repeat protein